MDETLGFSVKRLQDDIGGELAALHHAKMAIAAAVEVTMDANKTS